MKETSFISQNKEKWSRFEFLMKQKEKDPDELSNLFVDITDDFSYARTFYPNRSVKVYLNYLAQQVFILLYKNKSEKWNKFVSFWKYELPYQVFLSRKELLWSFLMFSVSFLIGWVSTVGDNEFAKVILSDAYVAMTNENIESGDPMAVYKQMHSMDMFLGITVNNMRVAFFTFVLGLMGSVGAMFFLVYNGIMVGAFQAFFYTKGLFLTSFLTIWIHGSLEISSIIIAGAAGITLGNGLLFPKTYSRLHSLQIAAKRGLKIMIGISPIIAFAAFLEGFLTRHTEMHDIAKALIIFLSFFFILLYFVWYPYKKFIKEKTPHKLEEKPVYKPEHNVELFKIRSLGELFTDTFLYYRKWFSPVLKVLLTVILPASFAFFLFMLKFIKKGTTEMSWKQNLIYAFNIGEGFQPIIFLFHSLVCTIVVAACFFGFRKELELIGKISTEKQKSLYRYIIDSVPRAIPFIMFIYILPLFFKWWGLVLLIILSPFLFLAVYMVLMEKSSLSDMKKLSALATSGWFQSILLFVLFIPLCLLFFFIFNSPVFYIFNEIITWHVITRLESYQLLMSALNGTIYLCSFFLLIPVLFIAFAFRYYSLNEKEEATGLYLKLDSFGKQA